MSRRPLHLSDAAAGQSVEREGGAEYLIEFRAIGKVVKVSAIDPVTGTEVSISGPASYGERVLAANAVRRLRYVMNRNRKQAERDAAGRGLKI